MRSKRILFSTLSLLALVAATAPQALAAKEYGTLAAEGKWKVGTVNAQGETAYCSMVNQFEKGAVLAFSRNADGDGSIAIAFDKEFFKPGTVYQVSMHADGAKKTRQYSGRANSEHAIIMHLGENDPIAKKLGESTNLKFAMEEVEATFALNRFGTPYASLQECSGALHAGPKTAAAPVTRVEKETLPGSIAPTPPAAVASAAGLVKSGAAQVAELEAKRVEDLKVQEQLKQIVATKSTEIVKMQMAQKELEEQNAAAASKHAGELALRILELEKERDALKGQVAENAALKQSISQVQADMAIGQTQIGDLERQLLVLGEEKQQLQAKIAAQEQQAKLQQESITAKEQDLIAAKTGLSVNAEKLSALQSEYSALKENNEKVQAQLSEKIAQYTEAERQLEEHNKNLPVMFKTAADLAAKKEETVQLQQQLDQSLAERQAAISSAAKAQNERDALNTKLTTALTQAADNSSEQAARELAETKTKMVELAARLEAQTRQTKLLEQALSAKEQVMASQRREAETRRAQQQAAEEQRTHAKKQVAAADTRPPNAGEPVARVAPPAAPPAQAMDREEANGFIEKIMTLHQPGLEQEDMPRPVGNTAASPARSGAPSGPPEFDTVIIQ